MERGKKRGRYNGQRTNLQRFKSVQASKRRYFKPGYDRTSGYYGRYTSGGEAKFHDLDIDDAAVANTGTIAQISCLTIAEGNGESERVGRKITVTGINWKMRVKLAGQTASANTGDVTRIILYQDKQTNGATAAVLDVLETADFQSFRNLANTGRFRILMDKTIALTSASGSGRGSTDTLAFGTARRDFSFYKKCSIPIEYDNSATTGVITSMRSNNLGVITITESGLTSFASKMRIRYKDH